MAHAGTITIVASAAAAVSRAAGALLSQRVWTEADLLAWPRRGVAAVTAWYRSGRCVWA
jgi:hypothetical protein